MPDFTEADVLRILRDGELTPLGLMPRASNSTLLCELECDDVKTLAVYKPRDGETPLWDFPDGTLCLREHAAFLASEATGWGLVPPTVLRNGPYGFGAVQMFVHAEPGEHYLTLGDRYADTFRRIAAFDVAINNADRKSGHCLLQTDSDRIWVVDHGVTFHTDFKLRTVIWDFAGEKLSADVKDGLRKLAEASTPTFREVLSREEIEATTQRIARLLELGKFPAPGSPYAYPWPPV